MARAIKGNAWQRNSNVSFANTGISESIQIRPSSNPNNPLAYAAAISAVASGRRADGQRVVFRPWFNLNWGDQPRPFYSPDDREDPNAWINQLGPYEPTVLPEQHTNWDDTFNSGVIAYAINPDYCMLDNEDVRSYWYPSAALRTIYFGPITKDDENNPYPSGNEPCPYIGGNLGNLNHPMTDFFISEWNQWAFEDMAAALRRKHLGLWSDEQNQQIIAADPDRFGEVPESSGFDARPISNYSFLQYTFSPPDTSNKPNRLPNPSCRIANISAPICYFNKRDLALFEPEAKFTTTRQRANRQRWKSIVYRLNTVRSACGAVPGDVHPWIQAPGWSWNGGESWANAAILPYELVIWRRFMSHLEALGIDTYNIWNPIPSDSCPSCNDPNSETTHAFMAAYFKDRTVADTLTRDAEYIPIDTYTFVTNDLVTTYSEVFEIETLYYTRSDNNPVEFLHGFCTEAEPLIISQGEAGDSELARMKYSIENLVGYTITTQEILDEPSPGGGDDSGESLVISRFATKIFHGESGIVNSIIRGPQSTSDNTSTILLESEPVDSQNIKLMDTDVVRNGGLSLKTGRYPTTPERVNYELIEGSGDLSLNPRVNFRFSTGNQTDSDNA